MIAVLSDLPEISRSHILDLGADLMECGVTCKVDVTYKVDVTCKVDTKRRK